MIGIIVLIALAALACLAFAYWWIFGGVKQGIPPPAQPRSPSPMIIDFNEMSMTSAEIDRRIRALDSLYINLSL